MILNTNTALNPLYAPSAELGRTPMEALMTIPPGTLLRTGTLLAAGWVGTEAPYTQEVAVTGLPAGAPGVMGLSPSATLAEYDEAAAAGLFITAQGEGTITVSATASLPAGGIPFLLQAENRETEASAILSVFPAKGGSGSGYIPPIAESDFTYTGDYALVDDGEGNWRLKFLTSGTFTPKKDMLIDAFLVGGGGAGYGNTSTNASPRPGGA
ncbi:MAG: hypothetical protein VB049_02260, partial [Candidatus Pelethousia sp.]|nr:hypothetical protein [Candidatus Pelethousia sp.]